MAKNNETTTKFKVDISELVKGMQTAKRQIALANAEFKSATAGMDNWSKSADGVTAKLSQLDKTLGNQKSILSNLEDQYRLTVAQMGEGSKEADNLKIKIENQKASIAKTEKEIRNYTDALQEIERGAEGADDALEDTARSADDLADSLDDAGDSAESSANGGFTIMKGALANLLADGIRACVDGFKDLVGSASEASNIFQASTGATAEAMEQYNDAIEDIYKNNFGDSLQDVAEKMAKVKEVTGELDAGKLQEMTEAGITLEDTFGMDMTETLRGVDNLMNHFGLTSEQAFDLMASGAQNGLNFSDELGDNVAEYSGKFAEAGYSAEEYFQLLANGSNGGAYNLDKVNDSINEVTARLADGTIADGIGGFSQSTQDLFTAWQNGEASQKDVIASIVSDIQKTTGEQEKMNLSALAFGTMAEDGGTQFIESLSSVGDSFTDVKGKMDEVKELRYDDVMSQLEGLGRTVKMDLITPFVEELLPYIKEGVQYLIDNMPAIKEAIQPAVDAVSSFIGWIIDNKDAVIAGIVGIGTALLAWNVAQMINGVVKSIKAFQLANEGATVAQWLLNTAMSANPIGIVIALIAGLVAGFVVLWNKSEAFRNFWIGLWDAIKKIVGVVIDAIVKFFGNLWGNITSLFSKLASWFNDNVITPLVNFFAPIVANIGQFFSDLWASIVDIFTPAIQWFSKLFSSIFATLSSIVNVIVGLLQGCWAMICRVFEVAGSWFNENVIQPVGKFFSDMWDLISSGAEKAWDFISGVFKVVADWFNDTIIEPVGSFFSDMWENLKSGASDAWEGIKSVFSTVAKFFGDIFGDAWEKVKGVFSTGGKIFDGIKDGIVSAFTTVVNAIIKGINKVIKVPFDFINGALNTIHDLSFLGIAPFKGLWSRDPISIPQIPELATGGVLRKGQTGYLEGDGREAVVPLDKNTGWLDEVANRIVAKGGLAGSQSQTVTNNYTSNYNQTNNSPKALSRLEIYRQTKNQFNYAVGGGV